MAARRSRSNDLPITDAALKELVDLPQLHLLHIYDTKITDEGLKELAKIKSLRTLNIMRTKVTAEGVAELRKALPKCAISK